LGFTTPVASPATPIRGSSAFNRQDLDDAVALSPLVPNALSAFVTPVATALPLAALPLAPAALAPAAAPVLLGSSGSPILYADVLAPEPAPDDRWYNEVVFGPRMPSAHSRFFRTTSKPSILTLLRQSKLPLALSREVAKFLIEWDLEAYIADAMASFQLVRTHAEASRFLGGPKVLLLEAVSSDETELRREHAGRIGRLEYLFQNVRRTYNTQVVIAHIVPHGVTGEPHRDFALVHQALLLERPVAPGAYAPSFDRRTVEAMRESVVSSFINDPVFVEGFGEKYGPKRLPPAILASAVAGYPLHLYNHYAHGAHGTAPKELDELALGHFCVLGQLACRGSPDAEGLSLQFCCDEFLLLQVAGVLRRLHRACPGERYADMIHKLARVSRLGDRSPKFRFAILKTVLLCDDGTNPDNLLHTFRLDRVLLHAMKDALFAERDAKTLATLASSAHIWNSTYFTRQLLVDWMLAYDVPINVPEDHSLLIKLRTNGHHVLRDLWATPDSRRAVERLAVLLRPHCPALCKHALESCPKEGLERYASIVD